MAEQQTLNPGTSMRPAMADGYQEQALSYAQVHPHGLLADRMKLSLAKLVRDKHMHTRYVNWGADQVGRWIGAVAVEAAVMGTPVEADLRPEVEGLLAAQDEAGLFYGEKLAADPSLANTRRVWFGQTRALWNLLDYYNITGDEKVWSALQKAADVTVANRDELKTLNPNWGDWQTSSPILPGIESSLGAMVVLGQQTGKKEYIATMAGTLWTTFHGRSANPRTWCSTKFRPPNW